MTSRARAWVTQPKNPANISGISAALSQFVGLLAAITMGWQFVRDTGADHERRKPLETKKVNKALVMQMITPAIRANR